MSSQKQRYITVDPQDSLALQHHVTKKLHDAGFQGQGHFSLDGPAVLRVVVDLKEKTYYGRGEKFIEDSIAIPVGKFLDLTELPELEKPKPKIAFAIAVLGEDGEDTSETRTATPQELVEMGVTIHHLAAAYRQACDLFPRDA